MNWQEFHKIVTNDLHIIELNSLLKRLSYESPIVGLKLKDGEYYPVYPEECELAIENTKKEILLRIDQLKETYLK